MKLRMPLTPRIALLGNAFMQVLGQRLDPAVFTEAFFDSSAFQVRALATAQRRRSKTCFPAQARQLAIKLQSLRCLR